VKKEFELLIALVREQMTGQPAVFPDEYDLEQLFRQAKTHKLEPFIYSALCQRPEIPKDALSALENACNQAICRDPQFDYYRARITQELTKRQVRHVYMRGICLKHDYPEPALRTMSDMDILVEAKDFPVIRLVMLAMEARPLQSDGNHRSYMLPGGLNVEFHPNLLHCSSPVGTGVNPGWQYVPQGQGQGEAFMTEEGFYLNVMTHLANHFASGGVGVRFVLDIWVCRHLRKAKPDRSFVEQELARIGLLAFARNIERLAEVWFSQMPSEPLLEELGEYILTSGSHGNIDRAVLNAASISGSGSTALWRKAFYPKEDLLNRYDWVRGRRWLLPVAWLVRAFRAVTRRWRLIFTWGKKSKAHSRDQITRQQQLLARFGLNHTHTGRKCRKTVR